MRTLLTTELRDAWRSLRATPIVTAVAVLSLALGIGANTALFSILNGLVLKTLPVREPARLAILAAGDWTNPIWEAIRARAGEIADGAFAWSAERFDLAERGETEPVDGAWISGRMFDVLGVVRGARTHDHRGGRRARRRAGRPGGGDRLRLWQRRYGGAEDIVGRRITIERVPFTIVGVLPDGFFGPEVGRGARRRDSDWRRAARPGQGQLPRRPLDVVAEHHAAAQAGRLARTGDRTPARRAAADPRRDRADRLAGGGTAALPRRSLHAVGGVVRLVVAAPALRAAAHRDPDRRRRGAADRLRQHRRACCWRARWPAGTS